MKKKLILSSVLATAAVATPLIAITSCELDEEGTVTNKVTSVSIKGLGQIEAGTSTQFTANVHGKGEFDKKVTWSIKQEDTKCKIDEKTGMFTAGPDEEKCTIVATSVENPKVFDTFEISIIYLIYGVEFDSAPLQIHYGDWTYFTAHAYGTPGCDTSVKYTIEGDAKGCEIDPVTGVFTANSQSQLGPFPVTVRATSNYDPSKYFEKTIKCISEVAYFYIDTEGDKTETICNGTIQFYAYVSVTAGLTRDVRWEIAEDKSGTGSSINTNGLFTAGKKAGTVTVRGTPIADPSKYNQIIITVLPDEQYSIEGNTATLIRYRGLDKTYTIPSTVENPKTNEPVPVTTIAKNCFGADAINLEKVLFSSENNVTTIEERAFDHSTIKNITIPKEVKSIGEGAFAYCANGLHVKFDSQNPMTELPASLFEYTDGVVFDEESLPPNVTSIPEGCFYYAENLTCFLRKNILEIGKSAFVHARLLSLTYDPEIKLKTIGDFAFNSESKCLNEFVVPDTVTETGYNSFCNCLFKFSFTKNSQLQKVGPGSFAICSFEEFTLPAGVTELSTDLFNYCTNMKHLHLTNPNITYIGQNIIAYCKTLEYIEYPGTSTQWLAIEKHKTWYGDNFPADAYVKCTDINVPILPTNK